MKAWTLGLLLMAAVLAEKALARPGEMDTEKDTETEDEGYQEDQEGEGGAALPPAKPPVLKTVALRLTPKPGETVVLPCNVENAPTVIWLNGTATTYVGERRFTYKDDMRTSVLKDHSLQIRDVQPSDSNSYTCKVADGLNVVHLLNVYEAGNAAPVDRISCALLLGSIAVLLLRS